MSEDGPRNRKERRAAARESGKPISPPSSTPKMKMAQPDRSKPQSKTLLDIYEEKKALLDHGQPFDPKEENSLTMDEGGNILEAGLGDGEPIGPVGNAVFWSITLGMVHFTLDVLVYNQYRQDIEWPPIFKRSFLMLPVLFLLMFTMSSKTATQFPTARQVIFLAIAVGTGSYTIHAANRYDYYAVMKQVPPLGTMWIWSVIEMKLLYALASVVIDIGFMWYKGYSAF